MKLSEVAKIVSGRVYGEKEFLIKNVLPPEDAGKYDLTFIFHAGIKSGAGAVITTQRLKDRPCIVVKEPKKAMYRLLDKLSTNKKKKKEISPLAIISKNAVLPRICVVEPYTIVKDNVKIGNNTYIGANCFIDEGVEIGKHCEIAPHTTIYQNTKIGNFVIINSNSVIGKEGFGYIKLKRYERLKHIGGIIIKDFVELGANVTIDRGTIGNTIIGKGTKIDNLVHIAHNVKIGKNCLIMGQCGIAGSTQIGNNVILCGQVGISDHLRIGDNAVVWAKSGVFKSLGPNKKYSGIPAREHQAVLKAVARLYKGL